MKKSLFICFLIFITGKGRAQDTAVVIGIKEAPPFIMFNAAGKASGLSIDFWDLVDNNISGRYVFQPFETIPELTDALEKGAVDMSINPLTVTGLRMQYLDFSQPFFISGTAIVRRTESTWWAVAYNLFSWRFLSAVLLLVLVIFIFGLLVWYAERRKNPEQFGSGIKGIGAGFWWSAVTMTTVGYGDKTPVSAAGRIIGIIWMFAAILLISGLTAGIASALTVSSLEGRVDNVEDLRRFAVGTIAGSSSWEYLNIFEVAPREYTDVAAGLEAVKTGELDMFVYDRPILRYYLKAGNFPDLELLKEDLKTDYYSFSFPKGSRLRDVLDPLIVGELKSSRWNRRLSQIQADGK